MQVFSSWVCCVFWSNSSPSMFVRTAFTCSHPLPSPGFETPRLQTCSAPPRTAPSSSSSSSLDHFPRKTAPSGLCPWDTLHVLSHSRIFSANHQVESEDLERLQGREQQGQCIKQEKRSRSLIHQHHMLFYP